MRCVIRSGLADHLPDRRRPTRRGIEVGDQGPFGLGGGKQRIGRRRWWLVGGPLRE
jgi:hypothetical protein